MGGQILALIGHKKIDKLSKNIKIKKRLRQGDTLLPILFTAALEEIFKRVKLEDGMKRKLNEAEQLEIC